jgi:hypothetical protein
VAERYTSFDSYARKVRRALDRMVHARLLLCEDTASEQARLYAAGVAAGIAAPAGGVPAPTVLPHCRAGDSHDGDDDGDGDDGDRGHGHD